MIRFNVKPKKDWIVGTDVPTATWPEARELLLKLSSREITGNAAKEAAEAMMASLSTDCRSVQALPGEAPRRRYGGHHHQ